MAVLPVWRSPRINSRWPRPIGNERIDDFEAGLERHGDRRAVHDGRAGRSMGRRWLEATGPLPSSGRPSGSMTRPSNPSPTATSMTRPVRSTSSPACRCQYSPSSTTPISSSSTLNAMPSRSPGNFTSSSKPTPGRPDTLAMPVATLVIVPTSRGVSCGVNASRTWLIPANARSKMLCRLSGDDSMVRLCGRGHRSGPVVHCAGLTSAWPVTGLGLASAFGSGLARPWLRLGLCFRLGFGLVLLCRSSPALFSSDAR